VAGKKADSGPPAPPPPSLEESGPPLPRGLRLGSVVTNPDGKEIQVYLYELPGRAGEMELVQVPAGEFLMGSDDPEALDNEKPKHAHAMEHAYWIGRNDVTWKQYLAYCDAASAAKPRRPDWAGDDHPVVNVRWVDAKGYCAWAKLDLPSEAEWEKSARGADGREYPWGSGSKPLSLNFADKNAPASYELSNGASVELAWRDMTVDDGWAHTSPVGTYPSGASPVGALDMAGNVLQWCEDWYDEEAYQRYKGGDASAPADGSTRVRRGGSWADSARNCRSPHRAWYAPSNRMSILGFRVVLRSSS